MGTKETWKQQLCQQCDADAFDAETIDEGETVALRFVCKKCGEVVIETTLIAWQIHLFSVRKLEKRLPDWYDISCARCGENHFQVAEGNGSTFVACAKCGKIQIFYTNTKAEEEIACQNRKVNILLEGEKNGKC